MDNLLKISSSQVSVVICAKNSASFIAKVIDSSKLNSPLEIIIVDGLSSDETINIAKNKGCKVVSDKGRGLSYARNLGAREAKGKFILYVGPDNILPANFINDLLNLFAESKYVAASVMTRVKDPLNFWDKGLDLRWQFLNRKLDEIKVVGTPSIYRKSILEKISFSKENIIACDDTYLSNKLIKAGFLIGLLPILVYDNNGHNFKSTWSRFRWYGEGDYEFFKIMKKNWKLKRKIKSLLHPFNQTIEYSILCIKRREYLYVFWFIYIFFARYWGCLRKYVVNFKI